LLKTCAITPDGARAATGVGKSQQIYLTAPVHEPP
jgi:hypothetical protein